MVYYVAGAIVLANIGTIVGIWIMSIRVSWWLSNKFSDLTSGVKEAKSSAVQAHQRINRIEGVRCDKL